jgi:hypothetical protein
VPNAAKDLNDSFENIFICTDSWKSQKHAAMRRLREQRIEFVKCGLFVHMNNRLRRIHPDIRLLYAPKSCRS